MSYLYSISFAKQFMDEEKCFEYLKEKQFKNEVHCILRGGTLIREPKNLDEIAFKMDNSNLDNEIVFDTFITNSICG